MNREQAKELLPIIEAFANGEDIQAGGGKYSWSDVGNSAYFTDDLNYRIKPKPREYWIRQNPPNEKGLDRIRTEKPTGKIRIDEFIHVREVLDES